MEGVFRAAAGATGLLTIVASHPVALPWNPTKSLTGARQAQLQAKTKETAQVAIDLAQAQHETLNLRQEQAEMVAQREQAEAEMSERAQRCTDAVENHRQEFEQSKRELQQVRHELEQLQGELEQSKRELQQVRHELEQAQGDLENSHRDAEKIRCGATEQEEKLDQVEAELASCREAMAAEQALLKQQIAALQLERDGLQGQIALDNDTMASHAPGEACKRVTNADNTDLVSGAGNLVPVAQQSQLNMNEGVPRKPTGLTSDVDCQLSAQRIQFSFRLSRLRKRLDEAVAGTRSTRIQNLSCDNLLKPRADQVGMRQRHCVGKRRRQRTNCVDS
eukprot:COSAG02_NODE_5009_length_4725_cov_3.698011_5_plen_335_part_00